MVRLPRLCTLPSHPLTQWQGGAMDTPHRFRPAPDVLVGHQLPAERTRLQRAYLLYLLTMGHA